MYYIIEGELSGATEKTFGAKAPDAQARRRHCSEGYFHFTNPALSFAFSNIIEMQPDAASFFGFRKFLDFFGRVCI